MSQRSSVYLDTPEGATPVGEIVFRSNDAGLLVASTFRYGERWLTDPNAYALCPELPLSAGPHTFSGVRPVPGAIADTGPDRWGQNLIFAAERRAAQRAGRRLRTLNEGDFILMANDLTRQGALRFSVDQGRSFVSPPRDGVPTLVDLPALVAAADRQQRDRGTDADLELLTRAGTSMGGARPKVSVRTPQGRLAIAKLPERDDTWDVLAWEATALHLARLAGISVPEHTLHRLDEDRSALVVERFDRTETDGRVGFISAHTLVEKTPTGIVSYVELADLLGDQSSAPDQDRHDLFRRVALSLLINNVDDHMKNHGLLRGGRGWRLSPVFDINPFPSGRPVDSTPIGLVGSGAARDVHDLVEHAPYFGLSRDEAAATVVQVMRSTEDWPSVARAHGIEEPESGAVATAFSTVSWDQARAYA